jgi:hypothetical protein
MSIPIGFICITRHICGVGLLSSAHGFLKCDETGPRRDETSAIGDEKSRPAHLISAAILVRDLMSHSHQADSPNVMELEQNRMNPANLEMRIEAGA